MIQFEDLPLTYDSKVDGSPHPASEFWSVTINGEPCKPGAFNVAEGWVEVIDIVNGDWVVDTNDEPIPKRIYGEVSFKRR